MTDDLEKLSFEQIVSEIVHDEIEHRKLKEEFGFMDNVEKGMGNIIFSMKEYKNRLNDLYREVARRDKEYYSGHNNHDHGGESG